MFNLIVFGMLLYCSYMCITQVRMVPFGQWGSDEYLMVGLTVMMLVVAAWRVIDYFRGTNKKAYDPNAELTKTMLGLEDEDEEEDEADQAK